MRFAYSCAVVGLAAAAWLHSNEHLLAIGGHISPLCTRIKPSLGKTGLRWCLIYLNPKRKVAASHQDDGRVAALRPAIFSENHQPTNCHVL